MLTVACVKVKPEFDADYVNKLYRAVERNLTRPHNFLCYTDDSVGLECPAFVVPHHNWPGWWAKMFVFAPYKVNIGGGLGQTLYFDLDTVITGNIDFLADYAGPFGTLKNWMNGTGEHASALISVRDDKAAEIWDRFNPQADAWMASYRSDQEWFSNFERGAHYFNDERPNSFCSYKYHVLTRGLKKEKVVLFHGVPRPHQVEPKPDWMLEHWR